MICGRHLFAWLGLGAWFLCGCGPGKSAGRAETALEHVEPSVLVVRVLDAHGPLSGAEVEVPFDLLDPGANRLHRMGQRILQSFIERSELCEPFQVALRPPIEACFPVQNNMAQRSPNGKTCGTSISPNIPGDTTGGPGSQVRRSLEAATPTTPRDSSGSFAADAV